MKKTSSVLIMLFILAPAALFAAVDNWHTANQFTVAWDAVTTLEDGTPVPANSTVSYKVYTKPDGAPSPITEVASVTVLEATITLSTEGKYIIGIKAIRSVDAVQVSESTISWSDDSAVVSSAETFGVLYYLPPGAVRGVKKK